jgi:hypothetical protein
VSTGNASPIFFPSSPALLGNRERLIRDVDSTNWRSIFDTRSTCQGLPQTVTLGIAVSNEQFDGIPASNRSNIHAQIQFGVGNGRSVVELDVKTGTQITLPSNSLNVLARFIEVGAATPESAQVYAWISEGSPPSRALNTYSYPLTLIQPAAGAGFPVPNFAYSVFMFSPDGNAYLPGALSVTFTGANSTTGYSAGQDQNSLDGAAFSAASLTDGIKLTQAVRNIEISNNSEDPVPVIVMFGLAV